MSSGGPAGVCPSVPVFSPVVWDAISTLYKAACRFRPFRSVGEFPSWRCQDCAGGGDHRGAQRDSWGGVGAASAGSCALAGPVRRRVRAGVMLCCHRPETPRHFEQGAHLFLLHRALQHRSRFCPAPPTAPKPGGSGGRLSWGGLNSPIPGLEGATAGHRGLSPPPSSWLLTFSTSPE